MSILFGAGFGLVAGAVATAAGTAALQARGIELQLDGRDNVLLVAGSAAAAALWAAIGVGLGSLVRNQVPTLIGICAWLLFVEGLLAVDIAGGLGDVGRFLPGSAAEAISGQDPGTLLAPAVGLVLLACYAAAAASLARSHSRAVTSARAMRTSAARSLRRKHGMAHANDAEGQPRRPEIRITVIVQNRYTLDTEVVTGRQIKEKANIPSGFALYRRARGGNESIRDDDMVERHEGDHFFARPSASRRRLDDDQQDVSRRNELTSRTARRMPDPPYAHGPL